MSEELYNKALKSTFDKMAIRVGELMQALEYAAFEKQEIEETYQFTKEKLDRVLSHETGHSSALLVAIEQRDKALARVKELEKEVDELKRFGKDEIA